MHEAIVPSVFEKKTSERVQQFSTISAFHSDFHTSIVFLFAFIADPCRSTCLVDVTIHNFAQVMSPAEFQWKKWSMLREETQIVIFQMYMKMLTSLLSHFFIFSSTMFARFPSSLPHVGGPPS